MVIGTSGLAIKKYSVVVLPVLILMFLFIWIAGCAANEADSTEINGENQLENGAPCSYHPYLFFSNDDLPALRAKIIEEPCQSWWQTIKADADHALQIDFLNSNMI